MVKWGGKKVRFRDEMNRQDAKSAKKEILVLFLALLASWRFNLPNQTSRRFVFIKEHRFGTIPLRLCRQALRRTRHISEDGCHGWNLESICSWRSLGRARRRRRAEGRRYADPGYAAPKSHENLHRRQLQGRLRRPPQAGSRSQRRSHEGRRGPEYRRAISAKPRSLRRNRRISRSCH